MIFFQKTTLLITVIICVGGMILKGEGINLVHNGNFTEELKYWNASNTKNVGTYKIVDGALQLSRERTWEFFRVFQDIAVKPDKVYTLAYRIRTETGGVAQCWVNFKKTDGSWDRWALHFKPESSPDWKDVTFKIPVKKDTAMIKLSFSVFAKATGVAYFDDVRLMPPSKKFNVVVPILTGSKLKLDGRLDDSIWEQAVKLGDFRVLNEPDKVAEPASEVLLGIQGDDLLVGGKFTEPDMDKLLISAFGSKNIYNNDCMEIFLAPDRKTFYQFIVNPLGVKSVSAFKPEQSYAQDWFSKTKSAFNGSWEAAASQGNNKWTVEVRIPLKNILNASALADKTLNMNFVRHRTSGEQKYSNWIGLTGRSNIAPEQFVSVKLAHVPAEIMNSSKSLPSNLSDLEFTKQLTAPKWPFAGKPLKIDLKAGTVKLPGKLNFIVNGVNIDAGVRDLISRGVCVKNSPVGTLNVNCSLWSEDDKLALSPEQVKLLASKEAFKLNIDKNGVIVLGRSRDGILRGLATLAMLGSAAKSEPSAALHEMVVYDAPRLEFRGFISSLNSPKALKTEIDILYLLRMNAMLAGIFGWPGGTLAFPYSGHPGIKGSGTKQEWADLAEYAKARGINLIPFDHTWARKAIILCQDRYRHLSVRPDLTVGATSKRPVDKNFCVSNPESAKLIHDLVGQVVDTIKPEGYHIGHDEIQFDDMNTNKLDKARNLTRWQYVLESATKTHDFLKSKGVRTYMWADMLNPRHNGSSLEISGKKLLEKFPKDIVMMYWFYDMAPYPFIKTLIEAGFQTVGVPWYKPSDVAGIIKTIYTDKGFGYCGSAWNSTSPYSLSANLGTAIPLGAYLSWSPENCDLEQITFLPMEFYRQAAYRYGKEFSYAHANRQIAAPQDLLINGTKLVKAMGFPQNSKLEFLKTPFTNYRGVPIEPFKLNGYPAAIVVHGKGKNAIIPLTGKAKHLTLFQCTNKQPVRMDLSTAKIAPYSKASPGSYVLHYQDGTSTKLNLRFRQHINDWNDEAPATFADLGLSGVVGGFLQVNIPTYTWLNPYPEKELKSLEIISGNHKGLDLILLGISVD